MRVHGCVLPLVLAVTMLLAVTSVVQSSNLVAYRDEDVPRGLQDIIPGDRCILYCRVKTSNGRRLSNPPLVNWFRKNDEAEKADEAIYEPLNNYILSTHWTGAHSPSPRECTEKTNSPGKYICDLELKPCDLNRFNGFYRCTVTSLLSGSELSQDHEINYPLRDPIPPPCYMPRAENLTVTETEFSGSNLSVSFTWNVTKKGTNETYCVGSRRWEVKHSSSPDPDSFSDREPSPSSGGFIDPSDRTDTSYVFHNLSRSLYYLFEVRNRKLKHQRTADSDEYFTYASNVYYFGEQIQPYIDIPRNDRTVQRVDEGGILSLSCLAVGKPLIPTVTFRAPREDGLTSRTLSSPPSQNGLAHLLLVDVKPSDAGEYVCRLQSTVLHPKRSFVRKKRYIVIVESRGNQSAVPTTGQRCGSLTQSTCGSYILDSIDVFFNTSEDHSNNDLKGQAEALQSTIRTLHLNDTNSKCISFLEAVMCHTLFPYCDRTTGTLTPRPICKSTCDAFYPGGPCGHLFSDNPPLFHALSANCDTRVNPAGSTPECIHISVDFPINVMERVEQKWCSKGDGRGYHGAISHTRNGHQCQSWSYMDPHSHPLSSNEFPWELPTAGHYCRNPGGLGEQPWCYTTNTSVRWDYCDVPQCDVCEVYSGEFCRELPSYNTTTAGVLYERENQQDFYVDVVELQMKEMFEEFGGPDLARGCQLALKQLLCHNSVPICKMQVDPSPKDVCSEHCHLVEVLNHCLEADVIEDLKNSKLTLPSCPGEPEADRDLDCLPSPIRIPPPRGNSTGDCYFASDYGHSYAGNVSTTASGLTCLNWDFNGTRTPFFNLTEYPELIENYCRNPGQVLDRPWCYTGNSPVTWDFCDLLSCNESKSDSELQSTMTTTIMMPHHGISNVVIPIVVTLVVGLAILIIVVLISNFVCLMFRKKANKLKSLNNPESPTLQQYRIDSGQSEIKFTFNEQYVLTQAAVSKVTEAIKSFQQYDRKDIKYVKQIGQGNFGIVYLGKMTLALEEGEEKEETQVAVKTLKEEAAHECLEEFVREAKIMMSFDHPNIIKLYGVMMQELPYCLIFEYMNRGDLANFLRENASSALRRFMSCDRPRSRTESTLSDNPPSLNSDQLTDICKQVAAGMEYLSILNHVHRDLACRNCLVKVEETMDNEGEVTSLGNVTIKIGDFGMSHNLYTQNYYRVRGQAILPVRWMAPESIIYGKFTTAADVWSFGVVMWEVFSFGLQPYYGMSNDEVTDKVRRGKNLSQPADCPRKIFQIMKDCWKMDQNLRPTFTELHNILNEARSSISSYSDDASSCRSSPAPSEQASEFSDDAFLEENSILNFKVEDSTV